MRLPEIILTCLIKALEHGAKGFWSVVVITLLILPFGIPVLLAVGFIKLMREKRDKNASRLGR